MEQERHRPRLAVEMQGIVKTFSRVVANDHIDFNASEGEIHALVGENGAGKSTLMSILGGYHSPDAGMIKIFDKPVEFQSPKDAIDEGINMVYQHFMVIPRFTVAENIILGQEPRRLGVFLDFAAVSQQIKDMAKKYDLEIDPAAKVEELSVGEQQRVELLKALMRQARILILDEPTSILTPQEVERLFRTLQLLKEQGQTIILITHKIDEVMEVSDRLTVLRQGKKVGERITAQTTAEQIAEMMVGRKVVFAIEKPEIEKGERILEVKNLGLVDKQGQPLLDNIAFELLEGEILGIAGIEGNGQTELVETLMGLRAPTSGQVWLKGAKIDEHSTKELYEIGLSFIPGDRQGQGLVLDFSVAENLILGLHYKEPFSYPTALNRAAVINFAQKLIDEFDLRPADWRLLARQLSGGNQQKLILAREFSRQAPILIAVHPTRGLDVAATEFVRRQLLEKRAQGGVLLISADLAEILALSDRIAVMYKGKIVAIKPARETDEQELGLLMTRGAPAAKQ